MRRPRRHVAWAVTALLLLVGLFPASAAEEGAQLAGAPLVVIARPARAERLKGWRLYTHRRRLDVVSVLAGKVVGSSGGGRPFVVFAEGGRLGPDGEGAPAALLFLAPVPDNPGAYHTVAGEAGAVLLRPAAMQPLDVAAETLDALRPEEAARLKLYYARARDYLGRNLVLNVGRLPGAAPPGSRIARHWRPEEVAVRPRSRGAKFPLDAEDIVNAGQVAKVLTDKKARDALLARGFVVVDIGSQTDVAAAYDGVRRHGLPLILTSDSVLHLTRVHLETALRHAEERRLVGDLVGVALALRQGSAYLHEVLEGDAKEAARLCLAYSTVAVELLAQETLRHRMEQFRQRVMAQGEAHYRAHERNLRGEFADVFDAFQRAGTEPADRAAALAAVEEYTRAHAGGKTMASVIAPAVAAEVTDELRRITRHTGPAQSALTGQAEDYTAYEPRGRYARSERLKKYFRALTWMRRASFGTGDGERVQAMAAVLLAAMMDDLRMPDDPSRTVAQAWDRIQQVTAYADGWDGGLTPQDVRAAARAAFGERMPISKLGRGRAWETFRTRLAGRPEAGLLLPRRAGNRMGFLPRPSDPDGALLARLVHPAVGAYNGMAGGAAPFTLVDVDGASVRGFGRGIDLMALLGSERAAAIVREGGDDRFAGYQEAVDDLLTRLKPRVASGRRRKKRRKGRDEVLTGTAPADWQVSLRTAWLYCLRALLTEDDHGVPGFMQGEPWRNKQVASALASWVHARGEGGASRAAGVPLPVAPPEPAKGAAAPGYVEPMLEVYARLLALTRTVRLGLAEMGLLDKPGEASFHEVEHILRRLVDITVKELSREALNDNDRRFIASTPGRFRAALIYAAPGDRTTVALSEGHADAASLQVLQEGAGPVQMMFAAYSTADRTIVVGAGPVLTYYEFKQPLVRRLTPMAWAAMVRGAGAPDPPAWTASFRP